MIKEIKYDTDTIVINTTTNTFYSEEKRIYDSVYSPESGELQFLIPSKDKNVIINILTGDSEKLHDESEVEF